jgi:hypothetical protein
MRGRPWISRPPCSFSSSTGPAPRCGRRHPTPAGAAAASFPAGPAATSPRLPPRPCPALRRLLARILGPDGPHLRQRQTALLLDLAKTAGSEAACYVANMRARHGRGVTSFRPAGRQDTLLLGSARPPVPAAILPPGLRRLLRQDPGDVTDDLVLVPQIVLAAHPADSSAHARLEAQERLARRYGQALLDLLTRTP